jgi:GntR family transcriptional regulator
MSKGGTPFKRTAQALAELLDQSEPGSFLPSEPALAEQLGVSRATLREAMRSFEDRGRIERRQGVGTYVRPQVIDAGLEELVSIERLAAQIGLAVSMGDLEIQRADEMLEVSRVILAEGKPVAYLVDVVAKELIPERDLEDSFSGSVLDLLLRRGTPELDFSETTINAVAADEDIAARLGVKPGTVLHFFQARLFDRSGQIVDHSKSYFIPGIFRFHVVRRIRPGVS